MGCHFSLQGIVPARGWTFGSCIPGRSFMTEQSGSPIQNLIILCISYTVLCARIAAHGWLVTAFLCTEIWPAFVLHFSHLMSASHLPQKAASLPKSAYNKLQGRGMTRDYKERITVISCTDFCCQSSGERIKWDDMRGTQVLGLMTLFHRGFPPLFPLRASFRSEVQSALGVRWRFVQDAAWVSSFTHKLGT